MLATPLRDRQSAKRGHRRIIILKRAEVQEAFMTADRIDTRLQLRAPARVLLAVPSPYLSFFLRDGDTTTAFSSGHG